MADRENQPLDAGMLYAWAPEDAVAAIQARHVAVFAGAPGRVLDVGCGRGIMLRLLRDAGIDSYGIDTSSEAVDRCRRDGLKASVGDALGHLASLEDGSLGGIFCSHVIEHLAPPEGMRLVAECARVLAEGGGLVLITPDPGDLRCFERFWLDPTHVRPYPVKLLRLLLERAGLRVRRVGHDPEPSSGLAARVAKALLRAWFLGFMFRGDRVVVAEKGSR